MAVIPIVSARTFLGNRTLILLFSYSCMILVHAMFSQTNTAVIMAQDGWKQTRRRYLGNKMPAIFSCTSREWNYDVASILRKETGVYYRE